MKDNNPFKPVLPKPISDSDLATDPHPDNFLAGDDRLSQHLNRRMTMDGVMPGQHHTDFSDLTKSNKDAETPAATETPVADKPADSASNVESSQTNLDPLANMPSDNTNDLPAGVTPADDPFAAAAAAADNQKKPPKFGGFIKHGNRPAAEPKSAKTPKDPNVPQKQVTISLLTIIFCVLFVIATAAAIYFFTENNKNKDALADAQAKVNQLTAQDNDTATAANKSTTNLDALQTKIQDLTKQNDDKQKQIDDKQKSIDDQNKKITDLNKQVSDLQNKVNSDKTVSDNMKSLVTTLCTNDQFKASSACVSNGQGPQQQTTPQGQSQPAQQPAQSSVTTNRN